MQHSSGLFCWERERGDPAARGRSLRYTLMTWLGLDTARRGGHSVEFDLARIRDAALAALDDPELKPGDFGLHLWVDGRAGGSEAAGLLPRLQRSLRGSGGLEAREGMEIAWIVLGLAEGRSEDSLLQEALALLLGRNRSRSGLLFHSGLGRRRRFPNFATQSYGLLALSTAARQGLHGNASPAAASLADRLLELQLPDGGWPWLFDAERGTVVERYEVYSVHQHGMAPMALLHFAETSGDDRYAEAARRGLEWIHGRNELGENMVDPGEGLILRSIRRRPGLDRAAIYVNTAASALAGRSPFPDGRGLQVNATCRPYELGWLLEAWAGRETPG